MVGGYVDEEILDIAKPLGGIDVAAGQLYPSFQMRVNRKQPLRNVDRLAPVPLGLRTSVVHRLKQHHHESHSNDPSFPKSRSVRGQPSLSSLVYAQGKNMYLLPSCTYCMATPDHSLYPLLQQCGFGKAGTSSSACSVFLHDCLPYRIGVRIGCLL